MFRGDWFISLDRQLLWSHSLCSTILLFALSCSSALSLYKGRVLALEVTHNLLLYFHALRYFLIRQG